MSTQEAPFTQEYLSVKDLEIDPRVQREVHNPRKTEKIIREYNPGALGIITVSRRNQVTQVIIDGWHRWEAAKMVTDNQGELLCHVFKDLTLEQEAQMFLDLNPGNQPSVMDRFRQRLITGDEVAVAIDKVTKYYGWVIQRQAGNGTLQCVKTLERVWSRSAAAGDETNVLQRVVMVLNRSWGNDQNAGSAMVIEGVAAFVSEYDGKFDYERLYDRLGSYPGGPAGLLSDAQNIAASRRMRVPMAVADTITNHYNRNERGAGLRSSALPQWRRAR